jgi:hypothetical protein
MMPVSNVPLRAHRLTPVNIQWLNREDTTMYHLYVMGGRSGRIIKSFEIMGREALERAIELVRAQYEPANIRAVWVIDLEGVIQLLDRR